MTWMQTYSGKQFWPLAPRVQDVELEDIAHALSNICRFNGHCKRFYSVAEHSLLVLGEVRRMIARGKVTEHPRLLKLALLHDAAEAYLGDIIRPVKHGLVFEFIGDDACLPFNRAEAEVRRVILAALGANAYTLEEQDLSGGHWEAVCKADAVLLATEARDLMEAPPAPWEKLPPPAEEIYIGSNIEYATAWAPQAAKYLFLSEAEALGIRPRAEVTTVA